MIILLLQVKALSLKCYLSESTIVISGQCTGASKVKVLIIPNGFLKSVAYYYILLFCFYHKQINTRVLNVICQSGFNFVLCTKYTSIIYILYKHIINIYV